MFGQQYNNPKTHTKQINNWMLDRTHLLMRPKQQLKNQLLIGFRKKRKQQYIDLHQRSQEIEKIYLTPDHGNYNSNNENKSYNVHNTSILDQFSRCPIREDQNTGCGETFLNKFMFTKNRLVFPSSAKTSVSVQTQKQKQRQRQRQKQKDQQTIPQKHLTQTQTKPENSQPNTITPPRIANFDPKDDKSIIDVSANLSNYKFPTSSHKKNEDFINNRVLTDSILGNNKKFQRNQSDDSAQELLDQLEDADDTVHIKKTVSQPENQKQPTKEPIVKKIQLTRPGSKTQTQAQGKTEQIAKHNDQDTFNEKNQGDQKIDKLLSKKSLIKSLIVKKNQQQTSAKPKQMLQTLPANQLQTNPNPNTNNSKWNKPKKPFPEPSQKPKITPSPKIFQEEQDPLDLLPPYETSSSGLQAVIEEQNQSEMEESIKHNNSKAKKNTIVQSKPKIIKEPPLGYKQQVPAKKQEVQKKPSQQLLKSVSLGDLSLEDVSQIQNVSTGKKVPSTFKKASQQKEPSEQLPDYEDSDNENKPEQKVQMQKYIVNDIAKDINNLKKRISEDASLEMPSPPKQKPAQNPKQTKINVWKPSTTIIEKQQKKPSSGRGSEGPDKKMTSMLDFFDEIHDKLDFGQISKDINDLRDKIANDSQ